MLLLSIFSPVISESGKSWEYEDKLSSAVRLTRACPQKNCRLLVCKSTVSDKHSSLHCDLTNAHINDL